MTNLVDRALGGAELRLHKYFYVGDAFVYTLAQSMPILKKKSSHTHAAKKHPHIPRGSVAGRDYVTMSAKRDFFNVYIY